MTTTHNTHDLTLYVARGCGYCDDVRRAARDLRLSLEERDVRAYSKHAQALLTARGRGTVPVLRIEPPGEPAQWMGESADIIRYLTTRFAPERGRRLAPRRSHSAVALLIALFLVCGVVAFGGALLASFVG